MPGSNCWISFSSIATMAKREQVIAVIEAAKLKMLETV